MLKLTADEEERVVRAIANAERGNRGEVRVHIEKTCPAKDPVTRAHAVYKEQRLDQTQGDTAVLLYVATGSRKVSVWAGAGIHGQGGAEFWKSVTDAVAEHSKNGKLTDGLVAALGKIGELLRQHVPGTDTAGNELPNLVTGDGGAR
ncbi:MAG: TPM domain-containing protein [Archangium sp.]